MQTITRFSLVFVGLFLAQSAAGQSPEPPLSNSDLTIHTLVREDIFAGWRANKMERHARGEKNIDRLLEQRPQEKGDLLAWKGGATLFHAILAHEAEKPEEFEQLYARARELFAEAKEVAPKNIGVAAVTGGSYVYFADRLPEKHQEEAWSDCYDNYQALWKQQSAHLERLPLHIRGELLAGLAQSSQRTGRDQELAEYLSQIVKVLPNTSYARIAKKWKGDPKAAATGSISCKTCHGPGRLSARLK